MYLTSVLAQIHTSLQQLASFRCFIRILLISILLIVYITVTMLQKPVVSAKPLPTNTSTTSYSSKSRPPPYLTYIISNIPRRFNFTLKNLQTALPNYFDIKHKQSVSLNDSRIFRNNDQSASSLLLTYIDVWRDFGARPEAEYSDGDWMFLFEDDVNVVSTDLIRNIYPKIYAKWNYTNSNTSLAGEFVRKKVM